MCKRKWDREIILWQDLINYNNNRNKCIDKYWVESSFHLTNEVRKSEQGVWIRIFMVYGKQMTQWKPKILEVKREGARLNIIDECGNVWAQRIMEWVRGEVYHKHEGETVAKVQLTLWPSQNYHISELMCSRFSCKDNEPMQKLFQLSFDKDPVYSFKIWIFRTVHYLDPLMKNPSKFFEHVLPFSGYTTVLSSRDLDPSLHRNKPF